MFLKKKHIYGLTYANLFLCFITVIFFAYLHVMYPLLPWTKIEMGVYVIILSFIAHGIFNVWLVTNYYPDKYLPAKFQGIIYTICVLSSITIITAVVIALFYGTISFRLTEWNFRLVFKLISLNLIILAILNFLPAIASFKLQLFIAEEYSKAIVKVVEKIGAF